VAALSHHLAGGAAIVKSVDNPAAPQPALFSDTQAIGNDAVEREAHRHVQYRSEGGARLGTGTRQLCPELSWCAAKESNLQPTD